MASDTLDTKNRKAGTGFEIFSPTLTHNSPDVFRYQTASKVCGTSGCGVTVRKFYLLCNVVTYLFQCCSCNRQCISSPFLFSPATFTSAEASDSGRIPPRDSSARGGRGTTCFLIEGPARPLLFTLSCQKICREPRMRDAAQTRAGQATRCSITVICYLTGLIAAKRKSATTFAQGIYTKYQSARS